MTSSSTGYLLSAVPSQPTTMTRTLPSHSPDITLTALDEPGHGGACHNYEIEVDGESTYIYFQNGPIAESGVNGLTHEVLIAILQDRLQGFQAGKYACDENRLALEYLNAALDQLQSRTKARVARGVEGSSKE